MCKGYTGIGWQFCSRKLFYVRGSKEWNQLKPSGGGSQDWGFLSLEAVRICSCLKPTTAAEQQRNLALVIGTSSCSVKNCHRIIIPISWRSSGLLATHKEEIPEVSCLAVNRTWRGKMWGRFFKPAPDPLFCLHAGPLWQCTFQWICLKYRT